MNNIDKSEEELEEKVHEIIEEKNLEINIGEIFKICYICGDVFYSLEDKNLFSEKKLENHPLIWAHIDEDLSDKAIQDNGKDYSIIVRNKNRTVGVPICSEKCLSIHNL